MLEFHELENLYLLYSADETILFYYDGVAGWVLARYEFVSFGKLNEIAKLRAVYK